ncbi:hypothetical protein SAMN05216174_11933 [Actinokineospora iranica]|uniref:ScoMcrA-like DNA sulfur-binding domain-containing protein n=1 Tax=Actinokineospora iranica TaxID=1271860 RepID=A0A1G6XW03_9PSEU|nr:hypothetical protein SAMN05216174_11933 [Actinokineospora iranica]
MDVVSRFERLRVYARQSVPSPHQPVALLWALGQEERLHRWTKFRDEVGPLLAEFAWRR